MKTRIQIIGDHPWSGNFGYIDSDMDGQVKLITPVVSKEEMIPVNLDCGNKCYATKKNLKLIE